MVKQGVVYCVGLGPGDPELITLKAIRILKESELIIVPASEKTGRSIAQDIVRTYCAEDKTSLYTFSMSCDPAHRQKKYTELLEEIKKYLNQRKIVSYVTLGDPSIYSTANYLKNVLKEHRIAVQIIPAVSSFNAASSALGVSLCEKGGNFGVYELPENCEEIQRIIGKHSSVVLMKINKNLPALLKSVKIVSPHEAYLIKSMGLDDEEKYDLLHDPISMLTAPLSVAVVKKVKNTLELLL